MSHKYVTPAAKTGSAGGVVPFVTEISRSGAEARGEQNTKLCLPLFSFAGNGGFAADLGRFGKTTLPCFR